MTLDEAIREAFGITDGIRRRAWASATYGRINYEADDISRPILFTFGSGARMVTVTHEDLEADDWEAYSFRSEAVMENWKRYFSADRGGVVSSLRPGDSCAVTLDDLPLDGDWILVWAVPYLISMKVKVKGVRYWPRTGMHLPLKRLAIHANGLDLKFHMTQLNYWCPSDDERLYQLEVVPMDMVRSSN